MRTDNFTPQSLSNASIGTVMCMGCECAKKKTKCCKKYKRGGKHCGSCPKK